MNRAVILLVAFATLIQVSLSAVGRIEVEEDPGYPNKCNDPVTGNYHDLYAKWRHPTQCAELQCTTGSTQGKYIITISGCPSVQAAPPCQVIQPGNLSLPYPDCCFTIECPRQLAQDDNQL